MGLDDPGTTKARRLGGEPDRLCLTRAVMGAWFVSLEAKPLPPNAGRGTIRIGDDRVMRMRP
jgi:hypothetical protein